MTKKPQRLPHLQSVIKRIFALCGNQCAFPDCPEVIVDPSGTMLGKVAHIHAAESGGPRYDSSMSDEDRRAEENLFIVCGKHHDIIDDRKQVDTYTAELLKKYKSDHEARFKKAERQLIEKFVDTTQINLPTYPKTLAGLAAALGDTDHFENNKEEIDGVRNFVNKLKELPLPEREFALKLAERMKRRDVTSLSPGDVESTFQMGRYKLQNHMAILTEHALGDLEEDEPRTWIVTLRCRPCGWNPWFEILEFCENTGHSTDELIHDLNFALYDETD